MANENDRVIDLVAQFSAELLDKGFKTEYVIAAFVAGAYVIAKENDLGDHLLDVLDHISDKIDPV